MLENKPIVFKKQKPKPRRVDISSQIMAFRDGMGEVPNRIVLDAYKIKMLRERFEIK
jgi:hypothetical protein